MILSISAVNKKVFARADLHFAAVMFDDMTSIIVVRRSIPYALIVDAKQLLLQGAYPTIIVILVYSQNTLLEPTPHSQAAHFGTNRMVTFERQVTVAESTDPYSRWKAQRRSKRNVNIELPELNNPSAYFLPSPEGAETKEPEVQAFQAESTVSSVGV